MRTRSAHGLWPDTRYPSFRRDPFARDVALDPGGTTMPRIPASLMLRSTIMTVSAPAISSFRGSLPHPTQPLCTLRVRRHRRLTQHSLPGGLLGPTWAGLAPADRASFCWRLPLFDYLVSAGEQRGRHFETDRFGRHRWRSTDTRCANCVRPSNRVPPALAERLRRGPMLSGYPQDYS